MNSEVISIDMLAKLKLDVSNLEKFNNDPKSFLETAGIPIIVDSASIQSSVYNSIGANVSGLSVESYWWGVDIEMNEEITQGIITGMIPAGTLGPLIASALATAGIMAGPLAALIGAAFATVFALKAAEIKLVNGGKGVHWPISWLQWGAVIAAIPGGPTAIVAAIVIFIHPIRNH
jgi:hypothetical protein